jgi:hypothetical protein
VQPPEPAVVEPEALLVWMKCLASLVLTCGGSAALVYLFGRENSWVYKLSDAKTWALKTGIAACTVCALWNAVVPGAPVWSEVLMLSGLALTGAWMAWFHYGRVLSPWPDARNTPRTADAKSKRTSTRRALQRVVSGK